MDDRYSDPVDETPPAESERAPAQTVIFEDLTLAQALAYLFWRPRRTAELFWQVLTRDPKTPFEAPPSPALLPPGGKGERLPVSPSLFMGEGRTDITSQMASQMSAQPPHVEMPAQPDVVISPVPVKWTVALALMMLLAGIGGSILHKTAIDPAKHAAGKSDSIGGALMFVMIFLLALGMFRWGRHLNAAHKRGETDRISSWRVMMVLVPCAVLIVIAGFWGSTLLFGLAGAVGLSLLAGNAVIEEIRPARVQIEAAVIPAQAMRGFWPWFQANVYQLMLVPPALLLSALTYSSNVKTDPLGKVVDVVLTPTGIIAWVLSLVLWILILAVDVRRLPEKLRVGSTWFSRLRGIRLSWTFLTLLVIIGIGAIFRLYDLNSTPPEMTSDHIEKLLDAVRVGEGYYGIFFPNNGGREGFQMAVVAFIAETLGVGYSFTALKLATVFEGLITLPALWWMARQVFGDETPQRRELGNWVGLALAGLVAVSSWHVMLSRLGLRIVLTPLTTALVIGFLVRVIRHNRMRDYLALGFTLGAGVYFYQANRMLPIIVVAGIGLALLARIRVPKDALQLAGEVIGFGALVLTPVLVYWYVGELLRQSNYVNVRESGERFDTFLPLAVMVWFSILVLVVRARRSDGVLQYGGGLLAVIVVALALYIPMYHYSELYPEYFWNRTWGRMFGEHAFEKTDPATGALVSYQPGIGEQIERFWDQRDVFDQNYQDALRMFHWEGDGAWINNPHSRPALDGITGGLLLSGVIMWGARLLRRPSPVNWLVPLAGLVMLLPSAMTLAYVIENPSFTRASGSIPAVFLLAALPLGAFCWRLTQFPLDVRRIPVFRVVALLVLVGMLAVIMPSNWDNFFTGYRRSYSQSWKPYREISKPLREFAEGEGSYGNAFMVAFPHWLDHRILGTMAGDIRWPNGLVNREDLPIKIESNSGTPYAYDPNKPLFVMYHTADVDTAAYLEAAYPGGTPELYTYTYEMDSGTGEGSFYIFRVEPGSPAG